MGYIPYSSMHDFPGILDRLDPSRSLSVKNSPNVDQTLASLIDLPGTVHIIDQLTALSQLAQVTQATPQIYESIYLRFERKLIDIRTKVKTSFQKPFEGKLASPNEEAFLSTLMTTQAAVMRTEESIRLAASVLSPDIRSRFDDTFTRGRQQVRWARADLIEELKAMGSVSALIEKFDQTIIRATEISVSDIYNKFESQIDQFFLYRLTQAIHQLDPNSPLVIDDWFIEDGWVTDYLQTLGNLCLALVDYEIDILLALIEAAGAYYREEIKA